MSACVQAVIAAEVGHLNLADDYLAAAALMDLDDLEHNTRDGLHVASLAGVWTGLVAGYGGMRHNDGSLSFSPRLPPGLTRLTFGLLLAGRTLRVEITHTAASYSLLDGKTLNILSPSAGHGVRRGTADLLHPSPAANRDQTDSTPRARPHTPPS